MDGEKTRRSWRWELEGSWAFESAADGTILFYPHGWGHAYIVPTEEKRCEIEEFLALWLRRLRTAIDVSRWVVLPTAVILGATILPPLCRIVWYVPAWHAIVRSALLVLALGCLLTVGCPLTLRFLAETAKAELEKGKARRPFVRWLREQARRYNPRLLWAHEALSSLAVLEGVWLLWPSRQTIMTAAHVDSRLLPFGIGLIALGSMGILFKAWQIRIRLNS